LIKKESGRKKAKKQFRYEAERVKFSTEHRKNVELSDLCLKPFFYHFKGHCHVGCEQKTTFELKIFHHFIAFNIRQRLHTHLVRWNANKRKNIIQFEKRHQMNLCCRQNSVGSCCRFLLPSIENSILLRIKLYDFFPWHKICM
jgi:hypothetical protein